MREWAIRLLGGFPNLGEAIDYIKEKEPDEKHRILTLAVKKLFNTISADDILRRNADGSWQLQGKPITPQEVDAMRSEADAIINTRMWKILQLDLKYHANKAMFVESSNNADLTAGKVLLLLTHHVRTRLTEISSLKPLSNGDGQRG